jgi:ribosome-associated protein
MVYTQWMIEITPSLHLDENELQFDYVRASGPGGQNVNKVSTAVQLRFDVLNSPSLPGEVRHRLLHLAGKQVTGEGMLIIEARRFRSQEQNRQDAVDRLARLIQRAAERPKVRRPTRPTAASRQRRLESKKRRSALKQSRRTPPGERDS